VVITSVSDGSFHTRKGTKISQDEVVEASQMEIPKALLTDIYTLEQENFPMGEVSSVLKYKKAVSVNVAKPTIVDNTTDFEMVVGTPFTNMDEVIAADNAITESTVSNETQALNFDAIEKALPYENEKSMEEVIAEDNKITENTISSETEALNFGAIDNELPYESEKSIDEVIAEDNAITENSVSNETKSLDVRRKESVHPSKNAKTIDEIIAEDLAITETQISKEAQALDFYLYNSSTTKVEIDNVAFDKSGKTIEEIIAEDNAITESNLLNEAPSLELEIVNLNEIQ